MRINKIQSRNAGIMAIVAITVSLLAAQSVPAAESSQSTKMHMHGVVMGNLKKRLMRLVTAPAKCLGSRGQASQSDNGEMDGDIDTPFQPIIN